MPAAPVRLSLPYPVPPAGRPLRIAFVGHPMHFAAAALGRALPSAIPRFVAHRGGDFEPALGELRSFAPHVVVVFRPDSVPAGALAGLRAAVLGVATEPLPAAGRADPEGELEWNAARLAEADRDNFDRVLLCDPASHARVAELLPAWRAAPLPVDDRLYAPVRPAARPPRAIFLGHSVSRVEHFLLRVKHNFDIGHYAYGPIGELLAQTLRDADIGINVHGSERLRRFDQRVLVHLAAGHLLLSEELEPTFGLEPGIDYLRIESPDDLDVRLHQLAYRPDAYDRVRLRGRHKAEQYRASWVWPRIASDLIDDIAAFGTERSQA